MILTLLPILTFWTVSSFFYFAGLDSVASMQNPKNSVSVRKTLWRMLQLNLLQIATTLPYEWGLLNMNPIYGFRWTYFIGGIFLLDTIEFFMHYGYHSHPWLYRHFHKTHHEMKTSFSFGALYNSFPEALLTGGIIGLLFLHVFQFTLEEFSYVTTLGTLFTCIDHCEYFDHFYWLGRREYHKKHHEFGNGNYQQPFFTFWDILFNTELQTKIKKYYQIPAVYPQRQLDETVKLVSTGMKCYESYPCQHDCMISFYGEESKSCRMSGKEIVDHYWDQLTRKQQEHFHYLDKTLVLKSS